MKIGDVVTLSDGSSAMFDGEKMIPVAPAAKGKGKAPKAQGTGVTFVAHVETTTKFGTQAKLLDFPYPFSFGPVKAKAILANLDIVRQVAAAAK